MFPNRDHQHDTVLLKLIHWRFEISFDVVGAAIVDETGKEVGKITSGCPAPSLGKNVAMGYVPTDLSKVGTKLSLKIREKLYPTVVSKMPFVKANYYNKPK